MICGKILRVLPEGLVVECGYTDLLRPPLTDSWLVPGTVTATRTPNLVESREPGAICVGTILLTDLPRSRVKKTPKQFDYVILTGLSGGRGDLHVGRHGAKNRAPFHRHARGGGE